MRTTTSSGHADRNGRDAAAEPSERAYDNPRRRREYHNDREDDDRQDHGACRSALRLRD